MESCTKHERERRENVRVPHPSLCALAVAAFDALCSDDALIKKAMDALIDRSFIAGGTIQKCELDECECGVFTPRWCVRLDGHKIEAPRGGSHAVACTRILNVSGQGPSHEHFFY